MSILILSSHLRLGLPKVLFPVGLPVKILKELLSSSILATCPAHLNLLDLITLPILGERYKLWSFSLWSLLHSPFSSLLGPNIRLRILFITGIKIIAWHNWRGYQFSRPPIIPHYCCYLLIPKGSAVFIGIASQSRGFPDWSGAVSFQRWCPLRVQKGGTVTGLARETFHQLLYYEGHFKSSAHCKFIGHIFYFTKLLWNEIDKSKVMRVSTNKNNWGLK